MLTFTVEITMHIIATDMPTLVGGVVGPNHL